MARAGGVADGFGTNLGRAFVRSSVGQVGCRPVVGQLDRRGDAAAHRFAVDTEGLAYGQDDLQAVLPDAAGIHRPDRGQGGAAVPRAYLDGALVDLQGQQTGVEAIARTLLAITSL